MTGQEGMLTEYAARILRGTGIAAADAAAVASGTVPATGIAAQALREGWQAAARATTEDRDGDGS